LDGKEILGETVGTAEWAVPMLPDPTQKLAVSGRESEPDVAFESCDGPRPAAPRASVASAKARVIEFFRCVDVGHARKRLDLMAA
jgi:hypothetical protein